MGKHVAIAQAKAEFAALVSRAEAGEEIIVTRNGRPAARLVPMAPAKPLIFGDLKGLVIADDLSLPDDVIAEFADRQ